MGRHTRLNRDLAKAIADRIRLGLPVQIAADQVGVGASAIFEWIQRGENRHPTRKPTKLFAEFAEEIKKAAADDQARRIGRIEQAARGGAVILRRTLIKPNGDRVVEERFSEPQWAADMTHLERRYPDLWGRRILEHTGPQGGPMEFTFQIQHPTGPLQAIDVTPQLMLPPTNGNAHDDHSTPPRFDSNSERDIT